MAVLQGYQGAVKLTTNTVVELDKWSVDIKRKNADTAKFGDQWDGKTPLTSGWTAKASGRLDQTDTQGQAALQSALLNGTSVALSLFVNATNKYSGTAFVSDMSVNVQRDGTVDVDFSFDGSGALTYA